MLDRVTDVIMPIALLIGAVALLLLAISLLGVVVNGVIVCH